MDTALARYLLKFKKLRLDRSHGVAPHKPILLISVIQSFKEGQITGKRIYLTPELVALFKSNWNALVTTNHDCRISYPFYHLKSEGFWHLKAKPGFNNLDKMGSLVKSFTSLQAAVEYAEISEDLHQVLLDAGSRVALLELLLTEYFPGSTESFSGGGGSGYIINLERNFLSEPPGEYQSEMRRLILQQEEEEIFLRGSIFKREIPRLYDNRCCISGLKVDSIYHITMVDACHIKPFSESYDDTVTNGIALCPNLHRAFDRGLITITPDYLVKVSDHFSEAGDYSIRQYEGDKIRLPIDRRFWPNQGNLEWHKEFVFR